MIARFVFDLAVRWAPEQMRNVAAGAYRLGHRVGYAEGVQEGRRQGVRPLLPKATDAQIDKLLANSGGQN